jgi:hypothetical protein
MIGCVAGWISLAVLRYHQPMRIEWRQCAQSGNSIFKLGWTQISKYIEPCIHEPISRLDLTYRWLGIFR